MNSKKILNKTYSEQTIDKYELQKTNADGVVPEESFKPIKIK